MTDTLKPLPKFNYNPENQDDSIYAEWDRHQGWWTAAEEEECMCGNWNAQCLVDIGKPIYLTGEVGVIYCNKHAPVPLPRIPKIIRALP